MKKGSSGNNGQSGVYHKLGSQATQPQQPQPIQQSVDLTQGPSRTSGYAAPQHPVPQYVVNPVAGAQGSHIVTTGRPAPASPLRVPAQHAQGSTAAVVLQQQQLSPQDVVRQQALMQLASFQSQLVAGTANQVVNVQLGPSYIDPTAGIPVHQVNIGTPPTSVSATNPYMFNDTPKVFPQGEELQISQEQIHMQSLLLPSHHQPVGTIHHHGQGSPRSTMPPLGFGTARMMSSHSPTHGTSDSKSPTAGGGTYHRSLSSPARTNPIPSSPSRMRKSPVMASETDRPPATIEVAELRTRLLEHKLKNLHDLQDSYKEKLAELFFLENGNNMMDFLLWKKRPNAPLHNYMASHKLEGQEEEITINDEVKVITNSGSNIPLGTPVAISTQLPPAVSALSSQLKAKELRKSFPGALPTASPDVDRKRTYSQAGLDGSSTSDRKPLAFPSTHEPNVTLSPKAVTPIPALPGSQPSLLHKQQQQHKQHAASQPQQQQGTSSRVPSTAASAMGGGSSHGRASLSVPHARREPKSPPAAKHSLHQLKLPISRPLTVSTPASADTTSTLAGGSPRRHHSGGSAPASALPQKLPKSPISPNAHQRLATRQHSLSAVYDYTIGSQEMIVERAKQEAQVMQRIAELRKEGLWSARRLPKVQEPPRNKTHWDYLLEEAQWLATDFVQERRWKKAAARKLVRAVARHHQEKHAKEVKAEREETQKLRRIAANIAKEIKTFWSNIEKVVQYKQQSRLEERRRKAMDMQLDYIVGQTEKYSSWLTEGLNLTTAGSSLQGSVASSPRSDPGPLAVGDDADFQPEGEDTDDEETIDVEEREAEQDQDAHQKELELLQKESQVPLEDLLGSLPPEMLEGKDEAGDQAAGPSETSEVGTGDRVEKGSEEEGSGKDKEADLSEVTKEAEGSPPKATTADDEFMPSTDDEEEELPDDEETLEEQEEAEGTVDHSAEVAELEAEGEMSIEELIKKYSGAYEEDFEMPVSDDEDEEDEEEEEEETEEEEDGTVSDEEAELTDVGMEYLINPHKENEEPAAPSASAAQEPSQDAGPNKEITDIAAAAQSLQPTGYTLSTTLVKTPVPFLLRHKLREYQHIGLDWLVTMNDKRLNGILADEMGLGKTIQTIALLAHLACEAGNWGPHLIVVPTSVMLNWEMEFKKWCPGFKILTYFGSQKERKQKRQGWTKSNAFHVCITSYKLVIQDHQSFRRKKWKYLVLDEAQNIKNFKSQRWQTLLNFNSQRRLLLTGTPLQNNLMELWSLMHFLMPHVFASHREFREWFSNPLSGMIEGTQEYNEGLIRRLHKVLRPFLLRRLKSEVEHQLPQKYEHLVRCRLSRRQRFLYDDFMSQAKTRETLSSGHFMSVINVLMQLRKVCNHPDLFEPRPIQSPFQMEGICYYTASLITKALEWDPLKRVSLNTLDTCIASLELFLPAYAAHRIKQLQTPRPLIEEIDSTPEPAPRPQPIRIKPGKLFPPPASHQTPKEPKTTGPAATAASGPATVLGRASPAVVAAQANTASGGRSSPSISHVLVRSSSGVQVLRQTGSTQQGIVLDGRSSPSVSLSLATTTSTSGVPSLTLVSHPSVPSSTPLQQLPGYTGVVISSAGSASGQQRFYLQQQTSGAGRGQFITTQPITVQLQGASGGPGTTIRLPASQIRPMSQGGIVQIVQTSSGHQVLRPAVRLASSPAVSQQQQQNQSRSSPVPIQMTLQATSPQIPRGILQQGTAAAAATTTQTTTTLALSQAQTVIQALAQAVTQASLSSGPAGTASQSQQLQTVLAQFQRQQLEQRQQQQKLQQQAAASQASTTMSIPLSQALSTTSQQVTKPIASVAPMVSVTVSLTNSVQTVVTSALSSSSAQAGMPLKPKEPSETSGVTKPEVTEPVAKTTAATLYTSVTSPPPLVAIRPHAPVQVQPSPGVGGSTSCAGESESAPPTPAPVMQPVLKIRPLSRLSIAKATGGPTASVTSSGSQPTVTSASHPRKISTKHNKDSPFFLESMYKAEVEERKATLARIASLNQLRCAAKPVYGSDLRSVVSILNSPNPAGREQPFASGVGLYHCQASRGLPFPHGYEARYSQTNALEEVIHTPEDVLEDLRDIIKRFVMVVPMATAPPITMHMSHPAPSAANEYRILRKTLSRELTPAMACLHPIKTGMSMQFPELRLIQYDCGKLQALDVLLRKLKVGSHRVLIFTQMTRMLDVLEAFLNYHGHIYVRLDGTTRVEQRQLLMDRFNMDKRIFCFILSTRSGGLGINLTGADTVIFYDSDWNPTMDAQAQDRCHRIGQTRDVHIYRLISEMTVEENILKKANQKRLLVDVSIEGGNFTTAFFKTNTIKDLFDLSSRRDVQPVSIEDLVVNTRPEQAPSKAPPVSEEKDTITQNQLEQALAKTEDETDVKATSKALAEQDAELAEFDETIPYEGEETKPKEEVSRIEIELAQLDEQLTNIEKYAMRYLEANMEPPAMDDVLEAEEQVMLAKKEWELERLQALKEEEERKAEQEEDEIFFTYCDEEAKNKVHKSRSKSRQNQGGSSRGGSQKSSRASSRSGSAERTKRSAPASAGRSTRRNPKPDLEADDAGPKSPVTRSGTTKSPPPVPPATAVLSPRSPLARLAPARPVAKRTTSAKSLPEKSDMGKPKQKSKGQKSDAPKEPETKQGSEMAAKRQHQDETGRSAPMDLSVRSHAIVSTRATPVDLSMPPKQDIKPEEVVEKCILESVDHELSNNPTVSSTLAYNIGVQPLNLSPRSKQSQHPTNPDLPPMPGLISRLTADGSATPQPKSTLPSVPLLIPRHPLSSPNSSAPVPAENPPVRTSHPSSHRSPAPSPESLVQRNPVVVFSSAPGVQSLTASQLLSLGITRPNLGPVKLVQPNTPGVSSQLGLPGQPQRLRNPPPLQPMPLQRHPRPQAQRVPLFQQQYRLQIQQQSQAAAATSQKTSASPQPQSQSPSQMPILARLQMLSQSRASSQSQTPALRLSLSRPPPPLVQTQVLANQQILRSARLRSPSMSQTPPRQQGQPIFARIEVLPGRQPQLPASCSSEVMTCIQVADPRNQQKLPLQRLPHAVRLPTPVINPQVLLQLHSQSQQQPRLQTMAQSLAQTLAPQKPRAPAQSPSGSRNLSQTLVVPSAVPLSHNFTAQPQTQLTTQASQNAQTQKPTVQQPLSQQQTAASRSQQLQTAPEPVQSGILFERLSSPHTKALPQGAEESLMTSQSVKEIAPAMQGQQSSCEVSQAAMGLQSRDAPVTPPKLSDIQIPSHAEVASSLSPPQLTPQPRVGAAKSSEPQTQLQSELKAESEQVPQDSPPALALPEQTASSAQADSHLQSPNQTGPSAQSEPHVLMEHVEPPLDSDHSLAVALSQLKQSVERHDTPSSEQLPSEDATPQTLSPIHSTSSPETTPTHAGKPTPLSFPQRMSPHPTHSPPSTQSSPNSQSPPLPKSPALSYSPEPLDLSPQQHNVNPLSVALRSSSDRESTATSGPSPSMERCIFDLPLLTPNALLNNNATHSSSSQPQQKDNHVSHLLPRQDSNQVKVHINSKSNLLEEMRQNSFTKPAEPDRREESQEQRNIFQVLSSMMKSPPSASPALPLSPTHVVSRSSASLLPMPFDLTISKSPQPSTTVPAGQLENSQTESDHATAPSDGLLQSSTPVRNSAQGPPKDMSSPNVAAEAPSSQQLAKAALAKKLAKIQLSRADDARESTGPRTRAMSGAELADKLIQTRSRSRHKSASPALPFRDLKSKKSLSRASSRSSSATNSRDVSPARGGSSSSADKNTAMKRGRGRPRKYPEHS